MPAHLKINNVDMSGFLTESDYEVITEPVYDTESEFVNIYGENVKTRTGVKVTVHAKLTDADDEAASVLRLAAVNGSAQVEYSAPTIQSGNFDVVFSRIALDKVYNGKRRWSGEFSACGYIRQGL